MGLIKLPISRIGIHLDQRDALADAQQTCQEMGRLVKISLRAESDITRDVYKSIERLLCISDRVFTD